MHKGNKLYCILKTKYPYTHEGDFFIGHPYNLKLTGDIHETSSGCNETYTTEIVYYFAALYITYDLGTVDAFTI